MFGVEESKLVAHFVGSVDGDLQTLITPKFWGIVLQRDDDSTFVQIGSFNDFKREMKNLEFDPVQMFVNAVFKSGNVLAFEFLDHVSVEREKFCLNGVWFDWTDLRSAMGDLSKED